MHKNIQEKLAVLPDKPGCYLMKNNKDEVIYVGNPNYLKIVCARILPEHMI